MAQEDAVNVATIAVETVSSIARTEDQSDHAMAQALAMAEMETERHTTTLAVKSEHNKDKKRVGRRDENIMFRKRQKKNRGE